jgi:hypothetical protein
MAFSGNLEDLPFSDIIQLLHVSKKSGTLRVARMAGTARIQCRGGFIVDAAFPGGKVSVAGLLLRDALVTEDALEDVRADFFPADVDGARLVMGLIDSGALSKEIGIEKLKELIQLTLAEIITWKEGDFSFDTDESVGKEEREVLSVDMAQWSGVDTQNALMDAFRVFDEKNRSIEERKERKKERLKEAASIIFNLPSPAQTSEAGTPPEEIFHEPQEELGEEQEAEDNHLLSALDEMDEEMLDQVLSPPMHALFLSDDAFLKHSMHRLCRDNCIWVTVSDVELDIRTDLETGMADSHSMVLVVDLGDEPFDSLLSNRRMAIAARMKERNPELPLVVFGNVAEFEHYLKLFELGARTVLPKPSKQTEDMAQMVDRSKRFNNVILGCLRGIFREEYRLRLAVQESRSQMASLKKRVHEIQDRKTSPDITCIILQFIAEFLQRGIIFLVRKDDLLGFGSFGVGSHGDTISTAAMRIRIPLTEESIFSQVVKNGTFFRGDADDPIVREHLHNHIGVPLSAEFLLVPLKTENKTIALVYCDFGEKPASPLKTDALEILASQAGMAMEIALQHSRQEKRKSTLPAEPHAFATPR